MKWQVMADYKLICETSSNEVATSTFYSLFLAVLHEKSDIQRLSLVAVGDKE